MDPVSLTSFDSFSPQRRKNRTAAVIWMPVMNAAAFVGIPLLVWKNGAVEWPHVWLFLFFFGASSMAITMGYHRLFAHASFKTNPFIEFLLLFFGAGAYEESALKWASMHRRHHQFTDTDKDPYNIKRGFFYAHMGWFMFYKQSVEYNNVNDLQKSSFIVHQHRYFQLWALASGVVLPLSCGLAAGTWLSALLWTVAAKIVMVGHSAFFINSFAHTFGSRPYDKTISARDNWVGAFLTNGEGYHNFHHAFPRDYRNGIRWFHWDPTKWLIWTLSRAGLAADLYKTPQDKIEAARRGA
jgi:stearoyl-CoA desaturase (Delta-9 desaturase)